MRVVTLALGLVFAAAPVLEAQRTALARAPSRPALAPDADTCDATAYYRYGVAELERHPDRAAAAFYWAQRLAPNTAATYYAHRVALLMRDRRLLRRYLEGDPRALRSAEVQRIDSLLARAFVLDPFFRPDLEEGLVMAYFRDKVRAALHGLGPVTPDADIDEFVRRELGSADPDVRASLALGRGQYELAAVLLARAIRGRLEDPGLRIQRARALYFAGALDSAQAELETALVLARRSDAKTMRYSYESKALWEFELGRLGELQRSDSAAREAYQRALVEDLSFYPAHVRLAYVAVRAADTATAVAELESAIEIKEDDYSARLALGIVLGARHEVEAAARHLRRAVEVEPWVAQPHFVLGDVLALAGERGGAAAEYRRGIALAARNDPAVALARERLAGLEMPGP